MAGDAPANGMDDFAQGVVEIIGPDVDTSQAFYEALGFELARRSGPFAVMHRDGLRLLLAQNPLAPTQPRWNSLRVMTNGVDALHDAVVARGIAILHPPEDSPFGLREFVVRDPNGFDVRFAEPIA